MHLTKTQQKEQEDSLWNHHYINIHSHVNSNSSASRPSTKLCRSANLPEPVVQDLQASRIIYPYLKLLQSASPPTLLPRHAGSPCGSPCGRPFHRLRCSSCKLEQDLASVDPQYW
jgi:hypothetical protein